MCVAPRRVAVSPSRCVAVCVSERCAERVAELPDRSCNAKHTRLSDNEIGVNTTKHIRLGVVRIGHNVRKDL